MKSNSFCTALNFLSGSEEECNLAFEHPTQVIKHYSHRFTQQIFKEYLLCIRHWGCNSVEEKMIPKGACLYQRQRLIKTGTEIKYLIVYEV